MNDRNNQRISDVENSTINQAQRDVVVYNGLGAADVIAIVNKVVALELSQYSHNAEQKLEERLSHFSGKLVEKLAQKVSDKIDRFNEPSLQFAVREAAIGYIKSGADDVEENLVDLMIERVKVAEHSTMQQLVDQAIKVIPTLSSETLALLTILTFRQLTFRGTKSEYLKWIAAVDSIVNVLTTVSTLDIEYLIQAGCAVGLTGLRANKKWEEMCRTNADLLFRHPATEEAVNTFLSSIGIQIMENGGGYTSVRNDNLGKKVILFLATAMIEVPSLKIGFNVVSSNTIDEIIRQEGLEIVRAPFMTLRDSQLIFSDEGVVSFFEKINPNWRKAIELLNSNRMISLTLTPVGTYIGSRRLSKLSGREIPMDIFYHD